MKTITVHFHRPEPDAADQPWKRGEITRREWLCGAMVGPATGDPAHVDCEDCLRILEEGNAARTPANQETA